MCLMEAQRKTQYHPNNFGVIGRWNAGISTTFIRWNGTMGPVLGSLAIPPEPLELHKKKDRWRMQEWNLPPRKAC